MKFFAFAVAALLPLFQVSQAAPTVKARNCASIPSTANAAVRDQVYRITQARAVTAKVLLATFEVSETITKLMQVAERGDCTLDCLDRDACQQLVCTDHFIGGVEVDTDANFCL